MSVLFMRTQTCTKLAKNISKMLYPNVRGKAMRFWNDVGRSCDVGDPNVNKITTTFIDRLYRYEKREKNIDNDFIMAQILNVFQYFLYTQFFLLFYACTYFLSICLIIMSVPIQFTLSHEYLFNLVTNVVCENFELRTFA